MAAHHLTVLSSPEFPQAANLFFDRLLDTVSLVMARNYLLGECDYEGDSFCCNQPATVHHLKSEQEFCERHFGKVVARG